MSPLFCSNNHCLHFKIVLTTQYRDNLMSTTYSLELYLDDTTTVIKRFSFVAVVLYIGSFETLYLVCIISVLCISQLAFIMKVDIHFTLRRRRLLHMLHSTVSVNFISQNNFELDSKILTIFNPTNESKVSTCAGALF